MMARAGIRRAIPQAGLLMMTAANAPDIDVFWSWFGGTAHYLTAHRGWTHSLLFSPVIALVPLVIVWLVKIRLPRTPRIWALSWLFSWIGVLSHLALDSTNIYGIRLLTPLTERWFRLDTVNVVDLAIWAILLLGIVAPALAGMVSSEIGAKPGKGTGWAVTVLLLLAFYEGGRWIMHDRALRSLDARIYEGAAPVRIGAFALNANPFAWRGVVETSGGFIVFNMNLLEEFDPTAGRTFYKPPASPAIEAVRNTEDFASLLRFSSWPFWRVTMTNDAQGASKVELVDLRFGTPAAPGLEAVGVVDPGGRVRSTAIGFGPLAPH